VLLAFQPEDKQKQLIAASAENVNNQQRTALLRRLKQVRRRGYEKRASQFVGGVTDLSAPVLDHTDCAVASITLHYLAQSQHSRPVDVVLEEVVVAAGKLSQKLQASN
ncbi:MAG: IclR family transcriptional regulator C-terminal domain-containing protein, partial [Lacipirellulaceae bacterium]